MSNKDFSEYVTHRRTRKSGKLNKEVKKKVKKIFKPVSRRNLKQPDVVAVDVGYMIWESKRDLLEALGVSWPDVALAFEAGHRPEGAGSACVGRLPSVHEARGVTV